MAGVGRNPPVSVASNSDEHGRHGAGNDEVEEPLSGRGVGDVQGAQAGGGDLAGVDPAGRAPAELEEAEEAGC